MKKLSTAAALLLVGALALAGCSIGGAGAGRSAEPTPMAAQQAAVADPEQTWADSAITRFLNGHGAASFRGFLEGTPHRDINSWSSPDNGVLLVELSGNIWSEKDLRHLAWDIMRKSGWEDPSLRIVRVANYGGSTSVDYPRSSIDGLN